MLWPPRGQAVRASMDMPLSVSRRSHCGQFIGRDAEGQMQRTVPVMGRDRAARQVHRVERGASLEDQEHALAADVVGAKARVADHERQLHDLS